MKGVPVPSGTPAEGAERLERGLPQSVHFSMARSVHFSMAIDNSWTEPTERVLLGRCSMEDRRGVPRVVSTP